ncbi:Protein dispatched-like [Gracilariopsis chorda]|uniref:Protein dispatched-like n=1 Tax=Gracilariopsis chorda TaxID=448386 RepID=A0A2V3IZB0_9FLOR|nr:Protein dispatched-like [Gracilariopsis chorda]|eukprot:PXF47429.1 Protein dispatched-like [Gracilariopsis chorda]
MSSSADAAETPKASLWARLSVNHTKKTCLLAYAVPIICLALLAATRQFTFDDPDGVDFFIRNDEITRLYDARTAAREEYPLERTNSVVERSSSRPTYELNIVFRGKLNLNIPVDEEQKRQANNVLTLEDLEALKRAEDDVLTNADYARFCHFNDNFTDCEGNTPDCAPPESVLNSPHLYGKWENNRFCGRKKSNERPSREDFSKFLSSLFVKNQNGTQVVNPEYSDLIGKDFLAKKNETWIIRSVLPVGGPFQNYKSVDDRTTEQADEYTAWGLEYAKNVEMLSNDKRDVRFTSSKLNNASFSGTALRDLSFVVVAIVLVFLVIWYHTGSGFLALAAMGQVFMSFPVAYVLYRFVCRQYYFAALQILSIFLLLGIGADDVFVFTDAWKQSRVELGTEADALTRMTWTYRRAVRAMTVTSITTAAAFFVTATSPIMPISTLGVWAGLLVLVQFALVITAYPSAVILWHRFWSQRGFLPCFEKKRRADEQRSIPFYLKCLPGRWQKKRDTSGLHYSFLERFFGGPWARLVYKTRYVLVAISLVLIGLGIFGATKLEPIQETEQFLPDDHPIRVIERTLGEDFATERGRTLFEVRVTWGISGIDRSGTSRFEPELIGSAELDESLDLRRKEAQEHILKTCKELASQKNLVAANTPLQQTEDCWISDYVKWRRQELGENGFERFSSNRELAAQLIRFGNHKERDGRMPYKRYLESQAIALSENRDRVVFTEVRFISPHRPKLTAKFMRPIYEEWVEALSKVNKEAPQGVDKAIVTGGIARNNVAGLNPWSWMRSQEALVSSMFTGIGIMLGVALITLTLSTMNWAVSVLATVCIGGIVVMLLGLIYAFGWELGTTETVSVVISIGYSFDGVAHIATAYVESSNKGERMARTRYALLTLGVSVWFGCLSTLLSSLLLFPAIITFFIKFAGLLISTVVLSLVWSLVMFPAVLMVCGPQGEFGSLKAVWRMCVKKGEGVGSGGESNEGAEIKEEGEELSMTENDVSA